MLRNKGEAFDLLLEDTFLVHMNHKEAVNTNNGIQNKEVIEKTKRRVLRSGMSYLVNELVSVKQGYPHDDISEVDFNTDFRVIPNSVFEKLIKFLDNE